MCQAKSAPILHSNSGKSPVLKIVRIAKNTLRFRINRRGNPHQMAISAMPLIICDLEKVVLDDW